eukprot:1457754-Prorocentrum_lima.AAC.1
MASTLILWVVIQSSISSRLANCFPVRMLRVENVYRVFSCKQGDLVGGAGSWAPSGRDCRRFSER